MKSSLEKTIGTMQVCGVPTQCEIYVRTKNIQHIRLFWAAHLNMQRRQPFTQDLTNPRKSKHKTTKEKQENAKGIKDSPAQAGHDGAEADSEQGGDPLSTIKLHCIPALRSGHLGKMGTNKHILHLENTVPILCTM